MAAAMSASMPDDLAGVVGHLIGREGGVGGHDELAFLNGGELARGLRGVVGGGFGGGGAALGGFGRLGARIAAGGEGEDHHEREHKSKKLLHYSYPLSIHYFGRDLTRVTK